MVNYDSSSVEILRQIEARQNTKVNSKMVTNQLDENFMAIKQSCEEFKQKKQDFLRYKLYDKYIEKEKAINFQIETAADQDDPS